jgi:A/G-specific adenine glycosylase
LPNRESHVDAVIFDLDGTLIDSEPNYKHTDRLFLDSRGISLDRAEQAGFTGIGGRAFVERMQRRGLSGDVDTLIAEKDDLYLEYAIGRTAVIPEVVELVRYLYVSGVPMAVATSSRRRVVDTMLAEIGMDHMFDCTVSTDDVEQTKPEPDIFLEAARRLGVEPSRCLVVEDSRFGVEAALRAGMFVVAVPEQGNDDVPVFDRAQLRYPGPASLDQAQVVSTFGLFSSPEPARDTAPGVPSDTAVERFRTVIYDNARRNPRTLSWRGTDDPYRILVSEFMLQQTQTARVGPYYDEFLRRFPTVESLARAGFADVLSIWQGLGYNRRAKYLHRCAGEIVSRFGGRVPSEHADLVSLPGVGPYTAAAIQAFAFHEPVVMVETNIRRVFLHFFAAGRESVPDRELAPYIESTLDRSDPRGWYYALMDYGVHLSRVVKNPNRRSAHYSRQSPFHGSVRQVRGLILSALTRNGSMSLRDLERAVGPTDHRLAPALDALVREKLITRSGDTIAIGG